MDATITSADGFSEPEYSEYVEKTDFVVFQRDKRLKRNNYLLYGLSFITIYSMILPVMFLDAFLHFYQFVYFGILEIPKIKRSDYLAFDRWDLSKLTLAQKVSCLYCEYVNGILAWGKDVANQTETYSCAIKHSTKKKGQTHQGKFYEREEYK